MVDDQIIPVEALQRILPIFGITEPTRAYERWVEPEGLKFRDVPDVLGDSLFVIAIDWRQPHDEAVHDLEAALRELNVEVSAHFDPEGNKGVVRCGDSETVVSRNNADVYAGVRDTVAALQRIVPADIEFRASPSNAANDSFTYAVLRRSEWQELLTIAPQFVSQFFVPLAEADLPPKPWWRFWR